MHWAACLNTNDPQSEMVNEAGGHNRFIAIRFVTYFTSAVVGGIACARFSNRSFKQGVDVGIYSG